MRGRLSKWIVTLAICAGVPVALVWIFMPYLDLSHATYLTAQGDYNASMRALNRALRFNSGIPSAYTKRGYVFEKLGNQQDAMADYNRAIQLNDSDWEPYNNRAWLQASQSDGDMTRALSDAHQSVSLCTTCAAAYDTRGFIHMRQGELEKALDDFNHAIGINQTLGPSYYHRALCFEKLNQPDKAKADINRAHAHGYFEDADAQPPSAGIAQSQPAIGSR